MWIEVISRLPSEVTGNSVLSCLSHQDLVHLDTAVLTRSDRKLLHEAMCSVEAVDLSNCSVGTETFRHIKWFLERHIQVRRIVVCLNELERISTWPSSLFASIHLNVDQFPPNFNVMKYHEILEKVEELTLGLADAWVVNQLIPYAKKLTSLQLHVKEASQPFAELMKQIFTSNAASLCTLRMNRSSLVRVCIPQGYFFTKLTELCFHDVVPICNADLIFLSTTCQTLRTLSFNPVKGDGDNGAYDGLKAIANSNPQLDKVKIYSTFQSRGGVMTMGKHVTRIKSLIISDILVDEEFVRVFSTHGIREFIAQYISFRTPPGYNDHQMDELFTSAFADVERFRCSVSRHTISDTVRTMPLFKNVNYLHFWCDLFCNSSLLTAAVAQNCTRLIELRIDNGKNLDDHDLCRIAECNPELRILVLNGTAKPTCVSDRFLRAVSTNCPRLRLFEPPGYAQYTAGEIIKLATGCRELEALRIPSKPILYMKPKKTFSYGQKNIDSDDVCYIETLPMLMEEMLRICPRLKKCSFRNGSGVEFTIDSFIAHQQLHRNSRSHCFLYSSTCSIQ